LQVGILLFRYLLYYCFAIDHIINTNDLFNLNFIRAKQKLKDEINETNQLIDSLTKDESIYYLENSNRPKKSATANQLNFQMAGYLNLRSYECTVIFSFI
jgi:hypothetical protein